MDLRRDEHGLVAAGGWRAPYEVIYDLGLTDIPEVAAHRGVDYASVFSLPEVKVYKGGPDFSTPRPLVYDVKPIQDCTLYESTMPTQTVDIVRQYTEAVNAERARLQELVPEGYIVVLSSPRWTDGIDTNEMVFHWEVVEDPEYGWDD